MSLERGTKIKAAFMVKLSYCSVNSSSGSSLCLEWREKSYFSHRNAVCSFSNEF